MRAKIDSTGNTIFAVGGLALGLALPNASAAHPDDSGAAIAKAQSDILAFYPSEAIAKGLDGAARIICQSSPHGALRSCVLKSESPQGAGFGEAALKIAAASVDYSNVDLTPEEANRPRSLTFAFKAAPPSIEPNPLVPTRTIMHAHWLRTPDVSEFTRVYPAKAARDHIGGAASVECLVGQNGLIGLCSVTYENPVDEGFGAAALQLMSRFRTTDTDALDLPATGATVRISITFVPPAG